MLTIASLRDRARISEKTWDSNTFKSKNQEEYLSYTNEKTEVYRDKRKKPKSHSPSLAHLFPRPWCYPVHDHNYNSSKKDRKVHIASHVLSRP